MLQIVAIKYNETMPVLPIAICLPAEGGTIGRDDDNTLVLPDPMRVMSRRHLQVTPDADGGYRLSNVSTSNPALLNALSLLPGEECALSDGDQIRIGCYLIEVRLCRAEAQPPGVRTIDYCDGATDPVQTVVGFTGASDEICVQASGVQATGVSCGRDVLHDFAEAAESLATHAMQDMDEILTSSGTCRALEDNTLYAMSLQGIELADLAVESGHLLHGLNSAGAAQSEAELLRDALTAQGNTLLEQVSLDPLEIFGDVADEALDLVGGVLGDGVVRESSHAINHRAELHTPFVLPVLDSTQEPAQDDTMGMQAEASRASAGVPLAVDMVCVSEAGGENSGCTVSVGKRMPGTDPLIPEDFGLEELFEPLQARAAPESTPLQPSPKDALAAEVEHRTCMEEAPPAGGTPETLASSPSVREQRTPAPLVSETAPAEEQACLFAALLEGLELENLANRQGLDPAFMRTLGALLKVSVDGTVQLIAARATVKREVRANVTLIAPDRNNPLKFSPSGEVALMYLLGSRYPGFMDPEEAVREAFEDLYNHQLGVVSGMRSALSHVLERFDPVTISRNANASGMIETLLSLGRKARLWDAYGRYFESTREQAEDRFQEFFGTAFVDAYEESSQSGVQQNTETP